MRWENDTIDQYLAAREYIDTLIMPIIKIDLSENLREAVYMSSLISNFALQLEEQIKGRVLLVPGFTYAGEITENVIGLLNGLSEQAKLAGFKNVVFLTQNNEWEQRQNELDGAILKLDVEAPKENELPHYKMNVDEIRQIAERYVAKVVQLWQ